MSVPVTLRPYQQAVVDEVRLKFRLLRTVLLQMPTGAGKTITAGSILGSAAGKGNTGMFICNRIELVDQTAAAFDKLRINYGLIVPGVRPNPMAPVQLASIQTLQRRIAKGLIRSPRLVVWDECRSIAAAGWKSVYNHFNKAKHLGLDATPERLDGTGLGNFFEDMVPGPSYSELVALGNLVPFDSYAPSAPDMKGVKRLRGDFDQTATSDMMDKPTLVGDIVTHYLKHAQTLDGLKLGLTFAVSRRHSEHLAQAYRDAGVPAMHLDGDTDAGQRKRIVEAYRRREIKVLTNVDLFCAGFDVPGVEIVSMGRPTQSLTMFLQQAGRASRPEEGKTRGILLDHAGNINRHGLPDDDREWSLSGREKKAKKDKDEENESVKVCEGCFRAFSPPRRVCPYCGFEHEIKGRYIEEVDGELRKITKADLQAERERQKAEEKAQREAIKAERAEASRRARREVQKAKTIEELEDIARRRGYDEGWAKSVLSTRRRASERYAQQRAESQWEAYRR